MSEREPNIEVSCQACDGTGLINRARMMMRLSTGEVSTVIAPGRCPYCRDKPEGHTQRFWPPV
ncbi:hypothetical protein [Saccharopolyspora rosea]|uniref:Uncharacterized protein n=1 Tax=Saccharopolyspora rosea TaxID=524884 RepID=A0ABW3FW76_9PSEU|nr:hypothetical protein [Saccharopolyspora rosea]